MGNLGFSFDIQLISSKDFVRQFSNKTIPIACFGSTWARSLDVGGPASSSSIHQQITRHILSVPYKEGFLFVLKKTLRCNFLWLLSYYHFRFHLQPSTSTFLQLHIAVESIRRNHELSLALTVVLSSYFVEREMAFSCTERSSLLLLSLSVCCLLLIWFGVHPTSKQPNPCSLFCYDFLDVRIECLWHWSGFLTS